MGRRDPSQWVVRAAEPTLSRWGGRLHERTEPLQPDDEKYGWSHAILCEALAQPYLDVCDLIDPPDPLPPWAPLFSIDLCPDWALPWLAQLVGVRIPAGMSASDARTLIVEVAGHKLGTLESMRTAAMTQLVSSNPSAPPSLWFRERDGSAYHLEVVTLTGETPDPAALIRVITAVKPAGLTLEVRQVDAWDYQQLVVEEGAKTYLVFNPKYSTYRRLREHTPG
jgi:hypothetical protein